MRGPNDFVLTVFTLQSFRQSAHSPVSKRVRGSSGPMFFVAGAKNAGGRQAGVNERRLIYQKFREVDKKKAVTARKPGEDRATLLGLGMILSSVMMYFVLGITTLRAYADSMWTEEGMCVVVNSTITADMNCSYSCGSDCWRVSRYPCLQVYVSINYTSRVCHLSHNEETQDTGSECFFVPKCQRESTVMRATIMNITQRLKVSQQVPCYYDPTEQRDSVILTRLYGRSAVLRSLFWPSCTLIGGTLIVVMVKLTQYLSILCEGIRKAGER